MNPNTRSIGNETEHLAMKFLQDKGLKLIRSQFRTPIGEIDLIMRDKHEIVFIEVRYRANDAFGKPYETVTKSKERRLIRTVLWFQKCNPWTLSHTMRFDVISILGDKQNPKITWIPNAFGVE